MTSKKRPKNRAPHRMSTRKPTSGPPQAIWTQADEQLPELDLLAGLDDALRQPHPLALLMQASSIMAALDDRQKRHPAAAADSEELGISFVELCETFMGVGMRQTDALLKVIEAMTPDELLAERIRRSVAERKLAIPGWTRRLDQAEPYKIVEMLHVLRDGDNVCIGTHLPNGRELSIMIYIDHNLGTVVKDAFLLDLPIADVIARWAEVGEAEDTEIRDLDFADARARVTAAILKGSITYPPFETDTWPACRPLVEWIVAKLPAGGTEYERPDWSDMQLAELTDDFFASPFARPLDDGDHRSLLESILWFGTDYGPGDPLRWSPVSVEILLEDWIPRKIAAPVDFLTKAPDLLRAFVRYCHAKRGIQGELTRVTLQAVDLSEPEFQKAIRAPRHQGAAALLERMGALDGVEPEDDPDWFDPGLIEEENIYRYMLTLLADAVGGEAELDSLNAHALPDEPFDWTGIEADIHDRVAEVGELVDRCCDSLFDREFRTACRRFVSRIAAADPAIFRGRATARTGAAAVCWVIGQANDAFVSDIGRGVLVKDLLAHFGVGGSITKRAEPMLRAIGADLDDGPVTPGDASLLTGAMRSEIIRTRDSYRSLRDA